MKKLQTTTKGTKTTKATTKAVKVIDYKAITESEGFTFEKCQTKEISVRLNGIKVLQVRGGKGDFIRFEIYKGLIIEKVKDIVKYEARQRKSGAKYWVFNLSKVEYVKVLKAIKKK